MLSLSLSRELVVVDPGLVALPPLLFLLDLSPVGFPTGTAAAALRLLSEHPSTELRFRFTSRGIPRQTHRLARPAAPRF